MPKKSANEPTTEMLEEYRTCRDTSRQLDSNIYQTATIFGIGSATAIAVVTQAFGHMATNEDLSPAARLLAVALVTALALAGWFTWWRMAERWRSVAYTMIIRMRHIERLTNLRANLYLAALDDFKEIEVKGHIARDRRVEFVADPNSSNLDKPYLDETLENRLRSFTAQHEYRGIRPMTVFLVGVNVAAWMLVFVWQSLSVIEEGLGLQSPVVSLNFALALLLICVGSIVFVGFLWIQWSKP